MNTTDSIFKILLYLAERSQDVFWIRSPDYSQQLYVSPIFEQIWGRPVKELKQAPENWSNYLHPEDKERLSYSLSKRNIDTSQNSIFYEEYRIIKPNGEIRWIKDTSFSICENNELIAFAGIAQDVTENKKKEKELIEAKEQAEAASIAKTEFLENMRHDIRTPLSGMIGCSEIIKQETTDPQIAEYADYLLEASQGLLVFLNEILDAVKTLTGETPVLQKKFSLEKILSEVIGLLKPKAIEKQLSLHYFIAPDLPKYFISDPKRLFRIILELITNGLKYTESGSVELTASLAKKEKNTHVVRFDVKDTGIGIPEEKYNTIFYRFNRLDPSYKGNYSGPGLGLANTKKLIEDLEGEIYCESTPGEGSHFTVLLPLQRALIDDSSNISENILT